MAGFLSSLFKTETLVEKLHREMVRVVRDWDDDAMVPEVREVITKGSFAQVDILDNEGSESSIVLLDKDEICVFFLRRQRRLNW